MTTDWARAFRALLIDSGYLRFYLAWGDGNRRVDAWREAEGSLKPPLRTLVQLFLCGYAVNAQVAADLLGAPVDEALHEAAVLRTEDGETWCNGFVLISFRSLLIFCQAGLTPEVYFGRDSVALGLFQGRRPGARTLDLCSGGGIQAMIAAQSASESHAVESNPTAVALAHLHLALNGLEQEVTMHQASVEGFDFSSTAPFDLITFNPPLIPVPATLRLSHIGDGGADGLDLTRLILCRYAAALAADGAFEFIGLGLGKDGEPDFVKQFSSPVLGEDLQGVVTLYGRERLQLDAPLYCKFIAILSITNQLPAEVCHAICDYHWERLGANEWSLFFAHLSRGGDGIQVQDIAQGCCNWFR